MCGLCNIYNFGVKELCSLLGDKVMLVLIVFVFMILVYFFVIVLFGLLYFVFIVIVDMDQFQLLNCIVNSFYCLWFLLLEMIMVMEMDVGLDVGCYIFVVNILLNFQCDVLVGCQFDIQINVDVMCMSQVFIGNSYIQNIISGEVNSFVVCV